MPASRPSVVSSRSDDDADPTKPAGRQAGTSGPRGAGRAWRGARCLGPSWAWTWGWGLGLAWERLQTHSTRQGRK